MCGAETGQVQPLLILSPGLFNATEAVTALLSSANRWANGSCHLTLVCLHAAQTPTERFCREQPPYRFWHLLKTIFTEQQFSYVAKYRLGEYRCLRVAFTESFSQESQDPLTT